jgi:hypothetical protein
VPLPKRAIKPAEEVSDFTEGLRQLAPSPQHPTVPIGGLGMDATSSPSSVTLLQRNKFLHKTRKINFLSDVQLSVANWKRIDITVGNGKGISDRRMLK